MNLAETNRDRKADAAKAAFIFQLIRTVNADPQMKPADVACAVAYTEYLTWPKRRAWLSMSRAQAMTGLSDRQVSKSRQRLVKRGYFAAAGRKGTTTIFEVNNPRAEDMKAHVEMMTEWFREQQAEKMAARRAVSPKIMQGQKCNVPELGEGDVPENSACNSPEYSPEESARKEEAHDLSDLGSVPVVNSYALASGDDPHVPFPKPECEEEIETMLSELRRLDLSAAIVGYFRSKYIAGELTMAMIEEQARLAS